MRQFYLAHVGRATDMGVERGGVATPDTDCAANAKRSSIITTVKLCNWKVETR